MKNIINLFIFMSLILLSCARLNFIDMTEAMKLDRKSPDDIKSLQILATDRACALDYR